MDLLRSPNTSSNTYSRLVAMAVSLVGEKPVMECMHCSESDFQKFLAGSKEPSWTELDRLVSLIIREQGNIIAKNRELLKKLREEHRARPTSPSA